MIIGDWRYFWPESLQNIQLQPSAWDSSLNTGIGQNSLLTLWITQYLNFTASLGKVVGWDLVGLLFWVLPACLLGFFSCWYLFAKICPSQKQYGWIAGLVYGCNSYILMVLTGGQLGVSLAYGILPFVIASWLQHIVLKDTYIENANRIKQSMSIGFSLGVLVLFDLRLAYIAVLFLGSLSFFQGKILDKVIWQWVIPFVTMIGLHAFWIIPFVIYREIPNIKAFSVQSDISFFSFADYSHSISLLHPNWPENIFGKVSFLAPQFLILPILAYSGFILFVNGNQQNQSERDKKYKQILLSFGILGIIGAFLAKGTQEPFGAVYEFFYRYIPGWSLFRDPTKFYIIIAVCYATLIANSIAQLLQMIKKRKWLKIGVFSTIIFVWFALHFQGVWRLKVLLTENHGVPDEYHKLTQFLSLQPSFFRTLWVPQWQRYGYFSNKHPAIGRFELLNESSISGQLKQLQNKETQELLANWGVKYVIVPYDNEKELFLTDAKYDGTQFEQVTRVFDSLSWLEKNRDFQKIAVYQTHNYKPHFYILGAKDSSISTRQLSTTAYEILLNEKSTGETLVFSEAYSKYWKLIYDGVIISGTPTREGMNSFLLPDGYKIFKVVYEPQQLVYVGTIISLITFGVLVFIFFLEWIKPTMLK